MAKIVFVTGGCRSGKSSFAQRYAQELRISRRIIYLATSPIIEGDLEMSERIEKHRQDRSAAGASNGCTWQTVEEEMDLKKIFDQCQYQYQKEDVVILVECLTLWVNNLLYHNPELEEENFILQASEMISSITTKMSSNSCVIFVSNELGMGLVPENKLSRRYRDFVGRLNQLVAQNAQEVFLVVSGISLKIK
ncbi:MAG: bifunctional adenosylcobinamide kinase/adenosylcobinamide-phosphate guanylyltransferase [Oligoflexia bacterium]|nr:bifunctional adenosylcobinamide kinase/adenosylcobinamide-phosphate guanylyltransferase [Oligoflexia bacterium]